MSTAKPATGPQPLIHERYIDVPSQRLYYLSLGLLFQAIKIFDFFQYIFTPEDVSTHYGKKWLFVDFAYCAILSQLRIPRLNYSKAVVLLQIAGLWFLDGVLFGGLSLNFSRGNNGGRSSSIGLFSRPEIPATPEPFRFADLFGFLTPLSNGKDAHLLGQHTVRMSPISTAQLNPYAQTFCLAQPKGAVLIPILLNNTNAVNMRYTLTPLGFVDGEPGTGNGKIEYVELNTKDLKAIEQARLDSLQLTRPSTSVNQQQDDYDEYSDENEHEDSSDASDPSGISLQKTQSLTHIRLIKPGVLRLERVMDASGVAARSTYSTEITVVPCPHAQLVEDKQLAGNDIRCVGQDVDLELSIEIKGVPPLSLRWYEEIDGRREHFLVEGIEGSHEPSSSKKRKGVFEELKVPLSVSLGALGRHSYVLEEVTDGVGNVVYLHKLLNTTAPHSRTARSLSVLRRPNVSFRNCGPGSPISLLIGSDASLAISTHEADVLDAPWDVTVRYQPPRAEGVQDKKYKPWEKTFSTQRDKRDLSIKASAPGEYTISDVKGKYCAGDVFAPESCKVIEKPLPSAEIEWKKIHECSGDTGVSASLILHGAPPFQVYYRTQRDDEPPRELSKTFTSSRGEITLQPERSGHYIYTFVHLSDAYYKKVRLDGPSVDQIVHPLAAADFSEHYTRDDNKRKKIDSCKSASEFVSVDLRGTGPWNLELQIVGQQSTETVNFSDITESRKMFEIPIPDFSDKEGGSFDVELVSVEDAYGCKRPISVPGISINVRRMKPTVKFYGKDGKRQITVLENERAGLPLRLTGKGPWDVVYQRGDGPNERQRVTDPNGKLHVTERGVYKLLTVLDSQCSGSALSEESTYEVDWIPKPFAMLSLQTESTYESYNGSHILPPICEGLDDHVDLQLTGRPPFQITYNVAQDNGVGGTTLLDQPTFSSIQPHTRFQLHTSAPGRKYYEVKQIGDASYPLTKYKDTVIPRAERLLFEQNVLSRPSARFRSNNRISYCLYDSFIPRDASTDGVIQLEGTPPFQLSLTIKNMAASEVRKEVIEVSDRMWKPDLPSYKFTSIGPHLVTIEFVQDASHCQQATLDPAYKSIWVDVAETAAIVPFDRREHYCVGDVSQFQLEGTPPWSIGYRINGKSYTQEAKVSPFSLLQQQPGEFTIATIAHQQKMCKAAVTDLHFAVHALPSAQVGNGKRIFQDIHEGDQAEILFTLVGEPPFTFTYQRSEASIKKGGKPGKVLETHTVSGVTTKEYSIYSALEGTWTVTSISDRYCRYPPAQPDGIEKPRH